MALKGSGTPGFKRANVDPDSRPFSTPQPQLKWIFEKPPPLLLLFKRDRSALMEVLSSSPKFAPFYPKAKGSLFYKQRIRELLLLSQ